MRIAGYQNWSNRNFKGLYEDVEVTQVDPIGSKKMSFTAGTSWDGKMVLKPNGEDKFILKIIDKDRSNIEYPYLQADGRLIKGSEADILKFIQEKGGFDPSILKTKILVYYGKIKRGGALQIISFELVNRDAVPASVNFVHSNEWKSGIITPNLDTSIESDPESKSEAESQINLSGGSNSVDLTSGDALNDPLYKRLVGPGILPLEYGDGGTKRIDSKYVKVVIQWLQAILKNLGQNISADGWFGPITIKAIGSINGQTYTDEQTKSFKFTDVEALKLVNKAKESKITAEQVEKSIPDYFGSKPKVYTNSGSKPASSNTPASSTAPAKMKRVIKFG
jgi:hypothetical protein